MDDIETLELSWQGLEIHVSIEYRWLNSDHHHIEIHCREPLPMTNTGYRSHFLVKDAFAQFESLEAFVLQWLVEASKSKD